MRPALKWISLLALLLAPINTLGNPADLNRDGRVDFQDFLIFTREFGDIDNQPIPSGTYVVYRCVSGARDLPVDGVVIIHEGYFVFGLVVNGYRIATWGRCRVTSRALIVQEEDHQVALPITIISPREFVIISKWNPALGGSDARLYLRALEGGGLR